MFTFATFWYILLLLTAPALSLRVREGHVTMLPPEAPLCLLQLMILSTLWGKRDPLPAHQWGHCKVKFESQWGYKSTFWQLPGDQDCPQPLWRCLTPPGFWTSQAMLCRVSLLMKIFFIETDSRGASGVAQQVNASAMLRPELDP